ncbi:uncharacterized protein LOC127811327 isoform X2 [Diospyros lotus]|uniref:uncharacterized protein LOC127811327 isoform X2 n=1 Tax=Diospyros lotus TaxID=55363 RepID=UPI00224CA487|nr:uncharacterized protein LOC127811327 isoform X2 [Diospyros lotus]
MAEDFEFGEGTFVSSGLKGRSSEPSFEAVEATEPTPEEQERSDDFPRSDSTVSFPKQEVKAWPERPHFGSESASVVQEKQEAKEEKVVAPTDVVAKMKCDVGDGMVGQSVSPPVNEKGKGLENYEVDFSGNQGFGEMEKSSLEEVLISPVVEDWNTGLATSCVPFDKNDSRCFLRSNSEQRLNETFVESILHDAVKTGEEPHNFCTDEKQSVFEGLHKMAENDKGNDGAGNCSLKIEVIDETAVIETNSAPNFGSSEGNVGFAKHSEGIDHKSIMKEETHARKEKRPRRRGKGVKNISESDPMKQIPNHTVEFLISCKKKSNGSKRTYSREELVAMRSVNLEEQRKKWIEVYSGLEPTVAREYDGLVGRNRQKHIQVNFDPRKQLPKKEKALGLLGEDSFQAIDNKTENMNTFDPACGLCISGEDDHTIEEGDCNEEDDSEDDYSSIQRPAFLVTGEPNFDSGPAQDGLEYLRRVRWEAAQIPKVKVAKLDRRKLNKDQTVYMPKIPEIAKCPEHLLLPKLWEDAFINDFRELRLYSSTLHQEESSDQLLESIEDENFDNPTRDEVEFNEPLVMAEKSSDPKSISTVGEDNAFLPIENSNAWSISSGNTGDSPTLCAILSMDSVTRLSTLRKRISLVENKSRLARSDCEWLFALCAAVDTPLDADTGAALRGLLRKCAGLRAEKSELDDEVIMLNILATITGKYFGQSED